jgi:hypothetical protein
MSTEAKDQSSTAQVIAPIYNLIIGMLVLFQGMRGKIHDTWRRGVCFQLSTELELPIAQALEKSLV